MIDKEKLKLALFSTHKNEKFAKIFENLLNEDSFLFSDEHIANVEKIAEKYEAGNTAEAIDEEIMLDEAVESKYEQIEKLKQQLNEKTYLLDNLFSIEKYNLTCTVQELSDFAKTLREKDFSALEKEVKTKTLQQIIESEVTDEQKSVMIAYRLLNLAKVDENAKNYYARNALAIAVYPFLLSKDYNSLIKYLKNLNIHEIKAINDKASKVIGALPYDIINIKDTVKEPVKSSDTVNTDFLVQTFKNSFYQSLLNKEEYTRKEKVIFSVLYNQFNKKFLKAKKLGEFISSNEKITFTNFLRILNLAYSHTEFVECVNKARISSDIEANLDVCYKQRLEQITRQIQKIKSYFQRVSSFDQIVFAFVLPGSYFLTNLLCMFVQFFMENKEFRERTELENTKKLSELIIRNILKEATSPKELDIFANQRFYRDFGLSVTHFSKKEEALADAHLISLLFAKVLNSDLITYNEAKNRYEYTQEYYEILKQLNENKILKELVKYNKNLGELLEKIKRGITSNNSFIKGHKRISDVFIDYTKLERELYIAFQNMYSITTDYRVELMEGKIVIQKEKTVTDSIYSLATDKEVVAKKRNQNVKTFEDIFLQAYSDFKNKDTEKALKRFEELENSLLAMMETYGVEQKTLSSFKKHLKMLINTEIAKAKSHYNEKNLYNFAKRLQRFYIQQLDTYVDDKSFLKLKEKYYDRAKYSLDDFIKQFDDGILKVKLQEESKHCFKVEGGNSIIVFATNPDTTIKLGGQERSNIKSFNFTVAEQRDNFLKNLFGMSEKELQQKLSQNVQIQSLLQTAIQNQYKAVMSDLSLKTRNTSPVLPKNDKDKEKEELANQFFFQAQ